ncbi:MAG: hypothetical protein AAGE80_01665 [Pseudomonadota bacterium]
MRALAICVVLCVFSVTSAGAVTFNEADPALVPGGDFSNDFANPTVIGPGFDSSTSARGVNDPADFFVFTAFPPGEQTISFLFEPETPVGPTEFGFNAGGELLVGFEPFTGPFNGTSLGNFQLTFNSLSAETEFLTPIDFEGTLFIAFNFTNGTNISLSVQGPPATIIPLPPGLLLLLMGLLGLGAIRRRRT